MLKNSKKTISAMVEKEKTLMSDIEKRVSELRDFNETQRKNNLTVQHQKDQLAKKVEQLTAHNAQLRSMMEFKED